MKKQMFLPLVLALLLSFMFVACNNDRTDETMHDTGTMEDMRADDGTQVTFWDDGREYTYAEREEYRNSLDEAVDRLDKQIERLEDRADNATGENKQMLEQRIDQLKERRTNIENRLNDWANITEEEWENFKSDINTTWNDIQNSYNEVVRDLDLDSDEGKY